jgi:hypothetical protein
MIQELQENLESYNTEIDSPCSSDNKKCPTPFFPQINRKLAGFSSGAPLANVLSRAKADVITADNYRKYVVSLSSEFVMKGLGDYSTKAIQYEVGLPVEQSKVLAKYADGVPAGVAAVQVSSLLASDPVESVSVQVPH